MRTCIPQLEVSRVEPSNYILQILWHVITCPYPWYLLLALTSLNRPISQIPKCIRQISHNATFCNRNVHTCAHFCYKLLHCGIWHRCILMHSEICDTGLLLTLLLSGLSVEKLEFITRTKAMSRSVPAAAVHAPQRHRGTLGEDSDEEWTPTKDRVDQRRSGGYLLEFIVQHEAPKIEKIAFQNELHWVWVLTVLKCNRKPDCLGPFLEIWMNFNSCTVGFWVWKSYFIPHVMMNEISYPYCG